MLDARGEPSMSTCTASRRSPQVAHRIKRPIAIDASGSTHVASQAMTAGAATITAIRQDDRANSGGEQEGHGHQQPAVLERASEVSRQHHRDAAGREQAIEPATTAASTEPPKKMLVSMGVRRFLPVECDRRSNYDGA